MTLLVVSIDWGDPGMTRQLDRLSVVVVLSFFYLFLDLCRLRSSLYSFSARAVATLNPDRRHIFMVEWLKER